MNRIETRKAFDVNRAKCEQIKELLERLSGVQDIGTKCNKRTISDLKKCYCYLTKTFTKASLDTIGNVLREGFNHATVIHNIKKFNELHPLGQLEHMEIYEAANETLSTLNDEYKSIEEEVKRTYSPKPELRFSYIATLIRIISKGHSIISRQSAEIHELKTEAKHLETIISDNLEDIVLDN